MNIQVYYCSVVEVELVLALPVPTDGRVQDRPDAFALVLPPGNVGLGDLPHESLVHQRHRPFVGGCLTLPNLDRAVSFRSRTFLTPLLTDCLSFFLAISLLGLVDGSAEGGRTWHTPASCDGLVELIGEGALVDVI